MFSLRSCHWGILTKQVTIYILLVRSFQVAFGMFLISFPYVSSVFAFTLVRVELLEFAPDFTGFTPPTDCLLIGLLVVGNALLDVDIWFDTFIVAEGGGGELWSAVSGGAENSTLS